MTDRTQSGPEGVYPSLGDAVAAAVDAVADDAPVITAGTDAELTVVVDHVDAAGVDRSRIVSSVRSTRFVSTTGSDVDSVRVCDGVPGVAVVGEETVAVIDSNPFGATLATVDDGSVADRYRELWRDAVPFGDGTDGGETT